jgi:hypothetical protein
VRRLHLGVELAGKKMCCPNPECRRIINVPKPINGKRTGKRRRY